MHENYAPYEIKLAREIASTLDDLDSIALHLAYVRKYQEEFLRKVLAKVMSIPEDQIKKTRAALYVFLIRQSERHGAARH